MVIKPEVYPIWFSNFHRHRLMCLDGSVATTFVFDAPVYVKNGVEVAIVLQTDLDRTLHGFLEWVN